MKPRKTISKARTPDGTSLELIEHDGDFVITADGAVLMSSRMRNSEKSLARLGCPDLASGARVLVGGLGMGFTLRAALDLLPEDGHALVVELVPEIVAWNRGALGEHAGRPLDDPRTELAVDDVARVISRNERRFDAILLDADNGPTAMVAAGNSALYSSKGLISIHRALKPSGRLAVWSAGEDRSFAQRLTEAGLEHKIHKVGGSRPGAGPRHVVFTGRRR